MSQIFRVTLHEFHFRRWLQLNAETVIIMHANYVSYMQIFFI